MKRVKSGRGIKRGKRRQRQRGLSLSSLVAVAERVEAGSNNRLLFSTGGAVSATFIRNLQARFALVLDSCGVVSGSS